MSISMANVIDLTETTDDEGESDDEGELSASW